MVKAMLWALTLVTALVGGGAGHTLHLGRTCPDVAPFPNLSLDKVLGQWYVVYKFDTDNTCLMWNLTRDTVPDTLLLTESRQLSLLEALGVNHKQTLTGALDIPNPEVPSKMRIRWPTSLTGKADFTVFDTDYDTYMAVFECNRAGILHRRSVAILARTKNIDEMFVRRVRRLLETADVSHSALDAISHDTCRQEGKHNWHVDEDLFGLLPGVDKAEVQRKISENIKDYDISEVEMLGEGIEPSSNHRGSLQTPIKLNL